MDARRLSPVGLIAAAMGALVVAVAGQARTAPAAAQARPSIALYAPDPNHIWNRVHRQLHVRSGPDGIVATDSAANGFDEVDPLLWRETRYLLTEPSHAATIRLLDEFMAQNAERLVTDPLKRAVFQHDLWAVFEWLAGDSDQHSSGRKALMPRLARMIRRVALTTKEIAGLPANYDAAVASRAFPTDFDPSNPDRAFLPRDLLTSGGAWVVVSGTQPVAAHHAGELGRSAFFVIWSVPGGAAPTREYFRKLWDFSEPYVVDPSVTDGERRVMLNPSLPAVPAGTRVALARQMLLIDDTLRIVPSKVTESVQLRILGENDARFFEFRMSRARLFSGEAGGLCDLKPGDRAFLTFSSQGIDPFERPIEGQPVTSRDMVRRGGVVLDGCRNCHQAVVTQSGFSSIVHTGIQTVQSVRLLLKPNAVFDSRHERWNRWFTQGVVAAEAKSRREEWGLLRGLWEVSPR